MAKKPEETSIVTLPMPKGMASIDLTFGHVMSGIVLRYMGLFQISRSSWWELPWNMQLMEFGIFLALGSLFGVLLATGDPVGKYIRLFIKLKTRHRAIHHRSKKGEFKPKAPACTLYDISDRAVESALFRREIDRQTGRSYLIASCLLGIVFYWQVVGVPVIAMLFLLLVPVAYTWYLEDDKLPEKATVLAIYLLALEGTLDEYFDLEKQSAGVHNFPYIDKASIPIHAESWAEAQSWLLRGAKLSDLQLPFGRDLSKRDIISLARSLFQKMDRLAERHNWTCRTWTWLKLRLIPKYIITPWDVEERE